MLSCSSAKADVTKRRRNVKCQMSHAVVFFRKLKLFEAKSILEQN